MNDALCKITKNKEDVFFPERGASSRKAKVLCRMCSHIEECLVYSLKKKPEYGIWGGLAENERRNLIQKSSLVVSYRK